MELNDVIRTRYSCRKFKQDPIPKELIENIFDLTKEAPSAVNKQPWKFVVVTEKETIKQLKESYDKDWFAEAPAIVVACGLVNEAWVRKEDNQNFTDIDVTIAVDHLILAATNEGLGTCWIGAFKEEPAKKLLGIPNEVRIVAMTPLGYPDYADLNKPRKTLSEILCWERWG